MARRRDSCPICGAAIAGADAAAHAAAWAAYRCPPRVLAAIDGAHRREGPSERPWPGERRRLYDGLRWQERDEDEDFDDDRPDF